MKRTLFAATLLFAGAQPSFAVIDGPWCMHMTLGRGTVINRCDMPSYEACRAEMRAMGGTYCTQNPYYWWNAKSEQPRRLVKRRVKTHH